MTKDETLLVFTLVVSSVSVFLFGILLFMILISATRDFSERTKSKLVKIMIWAERIKPLVEALYDKLPWIWEVSLSRYWDRLLDFLDLIATYGRALKGYKQGFANKKGNS
ncbi:hypothetical protein BRADI_3g18425v3 [Brachypodium distachyon]|uniref:Uncharacterized protein n=1 Tax=Brachypodium distachyon TaxID=15368 RepID=A0A0Q3F7D8_BRADI|nr:hypothetical protein BRADI_3g18425v3 [Brachypodium distachyon]